MCINIYLQVDAAPPHAAAAAAAAIATAFCENLCQFFR